MIVIFADGENYICISCTGTKRPEMPGICVKADSSESKSLGLSKDTYIYFSAIQVCGIKDIDRAQGRCPPGLFMRIMAGVEPTLQDALKVMLDIRSAGAAQEAGVRRISNEEM